MITGEIFNKNIYNVIYQCLTSSNLLMTNDKLLYCVIFCVLFIVIFSKYIFIVKTLTS
jgi:hypothetical protein